LPSLWRAVVLACLLSLAPVSAVLAQAEAEAAEEPAQPDTAAPAGRLPAPQTTTHELALPDRRIAFSATAGAIVLTGARGAAEAEIGFVAYLRDGAEPGPRPVTFVVNGGPGAASAYL